MPNENRNGTDKEMPMVVTTAHRGVFFGYGKPGKTKSIRLTKAQMCVYWSADIKGVMGLASSGPSRSCKIGPPVPAITLHGVTSIMEVSDEAEEAWQKQPWS